MYIDIHAFCVPNVHVPEVVKGEMRDLPAQNPTAFSPTAQDQHQEVFAVQPMKNQT